MAARRIALPSSADFVVVDGVFTTRSASPFVMRSITFGRPSDAFSVSAITAAQARANRFLTPDGMPFLCDFDTVLISPELEEKAKKMFGENARLTPTGDPESDFNAANPVYGMRYIVMGGGADGFTAKQWAVCDRRLMKELVNIVYNTRPTVMQSPQDNPLKDLYTAYADFGVGWGDARQIIFGDPS